MTNVEFLHKQLTLSLLCFLTGTIAFLLPGLKPSVAQSTFATLLGTIKDASGAVVASCAISVENTGTSARRTTLSDSSGSYNIPNLEPGSYTVKMEAPGFQASNYRIDLTARATVRVDGSMSVASQTQSVNVI